MDRAKRTITRQKVKQCRLVAAGHNTTSELKTEPNVRNRLSLAIRDDVPGAYVATKARNGNAVLSSQRSRMHLVCCLENLKRFYYVEYMRIVLVG
jgi:hypothetical protein